MSGGEGGRQAGPNFGGLVLGCIEANLCDQIVIFSAFFEIYKIDIPLHRFELKFFQIFGIF